MADIDPRTTPLGRARQRLWSALTSPHPSISDPQDRASAQIVSGILAIGIPVLLVLTTIATLGRSRPMGPEEWSLLFGLSAAVALGYALSRTRRTLLAAWALTIIGSVGPSLAALAETSPPRIVAALAFAVGGVAYAAFFLPLRHGRLVTVLINLLVVATVAFHPIPTRHELVIAPLVIAVFSVFVLIGQHVMSRSLETIRAQARQLRDLIEKTPIGMAVLRGTRLVYANPALVEALQATNSDELIGANLVDHLHAEDRHLLERPRHHHHLEMRLRRKDGAYRVFDAAVIPHVGLEGAGTRLLVAKDVTEQRDIRERLILTERLASLGTIAASVGHEVNNPLTFVLFNLDFMREELPELLAASPHRDRVLEILKVLGDTRDGAKRASDIVTELKAFSRTDDDEPGEVDVEAVLRSSIRVASTELRHHARVLEEWGPLPRVQGSTSRLGQVFLNLLVNAAQAIPPGNADQNEVRIRTGTSETGEAVIEIRDTGSGIPDELRGRIFEPFFTTKPTGQGTGLGLAICVKIIRDLGGRIEVSSALGSGTTFRVVLPAVTTTMRRSEPPTAPVSSGARFDDHVLIVEDDHRVAEALRRLLRNYEVTVAHNGDEALALCRERRFDAVVCDLVMPKRPGWELHEALAADNPDLASRMIFVTAGATRPQARNFLARVDNPVLEKPFDAEELKRLVRATCSRD